MSKVDRGRRYALVRSMTKAELVHKILELSRVCDSAFEYIDALPEDIVLTSMPGFDRDWADTVRDLGYKIGNGESL